MGGILAIGALFGSVSFMVEADSKRVKDIFMMVGGIGFVAAFILGQVLWLYREELKSGPLYFKYKGKQLWVKIIKDAFWSLMSIMFLKIIQVMKMF
jgi:hypothetical protein